MDNEISPLVNNIRSISQNMLCFIGELFLKMCVHENARSLLKKASCQLTARVHPFGSVTDAHDKRTIWGYINDILLSSLAWTGISFLLFTVLVAVISAWKTRDEQLDTAEGYFLAGRGLPGVVIAGSLLLTNLSAEQLVGLNGQSWKTEAMGPIAWEVGSMFTLLVLAYYFLPKYLKLGAMTIPSLMEERYGKGTKTMFSLVVVVMYSILNLPVILYSGAVVFEQIFDISGILGTSKFMAVAILCLIIGIIGACYAIFGGLKAVAVSDTINGIGLIIGGFMIPIFGFAALSAATGGHGIMDGIKYIVEADPAKMNAINAWNAPEPEVPWPLIITGMFFNNLYWWCTNQSFVQRSLAAKSLKEGQKGAIFCGFLKCLGPLYLVIPGVIAFYLPVHSGQAGCCRFLRYRLCLPGSDR